MESKIVLRAELPELKGKNRTEVFPIYKELLGEPETLDEFDGEIEYFQYAGKYQAVQDYKENRWGIDLVLHHESNYRTYIEMETNGLSLEEFERLATEMAEKFNVDKKKIRLMSYSWYNGVDEPIFFE